MLTLVAEGPDADATEPSAPGQADLGTDAVDVIEPQLPRAQRTCLTGPRAVDAPGRRLASVVATRCPLLTSAATAVAGTSAMCDPPSLINWQTRSLTS